MKIPIKKLPWCNNHNKGIRMNYVGTHVTDYGTKIYKFKCAQCNNKKRLPAINFE